MKKHIYDEQNGLHHTLYGDYCRILSFPKRNICRSASMEECVKPT